MRNLIFIVFVGLTSCGNFGKHKTTPFYILVNCESVELAPNGKYRYTFTIKNADVQKGVFGGNVEICIVSKEGKSVRYETFDFPSFNLGQSQSVNIEAMTGPVSVHGNAGISRYGYVINDLSNSLTEEKFVDL